MKTKIRPSQFLIMGNEAPQMPQIPASVPHLPTSPLATTSLENAKPQVKPGFLQFQEK